MSLLTAHKIWIQNGNTALQSGAGPWIIKGGQTMPVVGTAWPKHKSITHAGAPPESGVEKMIGQCLCVSLCARLSFHDSPRFSGALAPQCTQQSAHELSTQEMAMHGRHTPWSGCQPTGVRRAPCHHAGSSCAGRSLSARDPGHPLWACPWR